MQVVYVIYVTDLENKRIYILHRRYGRNLVGISLISILNIWTGNEVSFFISHFHGFISFSVFFMRKHVHSYTLHSLKCTMYKGNITGLYLSVSMVYSEVVAYFGQMLKPCYVMLLETLAFVFICFPLPSISTPEPRETKQFPFIFQDEDKNYSSP